STETEAWLRAAASDPAVVAIGETGLDYHYDHAPRPAQRTAFAAQLALGTELGKPVVVHAREADDDVTAALRAQPGVTAILHSFSSGMPLLWAALAMGHHVSFSGMITFRNWALDDAVRDTPLDRILVETDGPYLAPVPHRGKRNEPAFVRHTAERAAAVKGVAADELIARSGENALRLFGPRIAAGAPAATSQD
ncbi:MAG: TatD family hydrolase, partial [Gemmatimonadota bacterium]|nr:TatD family hydrolase [Gemmatimonadota bacterium]